MEETEKSVVFMGIEVVSLSISFYEALPCTCCGGEWQIDGSLMGVVSESVGDDGHSVSVIEQGVNKWEKTLRSGL